MKAKCIFFAATRRSLMYFSCSYLVSNNQSRILFLAITKAKAPVSILGFKADLKALSVLRLALELKIRTGCGTRSSS